MKPRNIEILEELEKDTNLNIVELFSYRTSTAWINIKNYIYSKSINSEFFVENKKWNKKKAIYFFFLSLVNILKRKKGVLFVTAGSGILLYKDKIVDVYKNGIKENNLIYFSSIDDLERMYKMKEYYKKNNIVVHSLLFSVLRNILAKVIKNSIKLEDNKINEFLNYLEKNKIRAKKEDIKYIYAKFIIGYWIYKILFKILHIKKAYVVSAYTNTELIAALKEKGIPIIEIQHGIVGEMHRGYNYKVDSNLLPTPNKILVYNKFWKQELIEAGYYKSNQIDLFKKFQYKAVKNIEIFDKPFIVFTGQGIKQKEVERFLEKSKKFLKEKNIYLIYIPHPTEKNSFNNIKSKYIKILENKKYLTEQYIKSAISHISIYSSCHFDALHFHGKTYVLDVLTNNIMEYYKQKYPQKVIFIKNIEEIKI